MTCKVQHLPGQRMKMGPDKVPCGWVSHNSRLTSEKKRIEELNRTPPWGLLCKDFWGSRNDWSPGFPSFPKGKDITSLRKTAGIKQECFCSRNHLCDSWASKGMYLHLIDASWCITFPCPLPASSVLKRELLITAQGQFSNFRKK